MNPFRKFAEIAEASAEPVWVSVLLWGLAIVWSLAAWAVLA